MDILLQSKLFYNYFTETVKTEAPKPAPAKPFNKPNNNQQFKKKEEPAKPVDDDMLKLLADKFKKG